MFLNYKKLLAYTVMCPTCPGYEPIAEAVANYFHGVKPIVDQVVVYIMKEWNTALKDLVKENDVEVAKSTIGFYDPSKHRIGLTPEILITDQVSFIHEVVHGVLSPERNTKEFHVFEEVLTDMVAQEINDTLGLTTTPHPGGYEKFNYGLSNYLDVIHMNLQDFANEYATSVHEKQQSDWLRAFTIERFIQLNPQVDNIKNAMDENFIEQYLPEWVEIFDMLNIPIEDIQEVLNG